MHDRSSTGERPLRVAVLDSDTGFVQVLSKRMERLRWEQRVLATPVRTEDLVVMRLSALVVDLTCVGPEPFDYLDRVCAELPDLPVVVVTRQSSVAQRVRGLRMGADDWVTKPCHPEEVIARVEGVVRRRRRANAPAAVDPVRAGEVTIRDDQFQAYVGSRSVDLTRREFELLQLLASAQGRVLEREEIYQRVWGYAMARGDRSVDVFVRKVRAKLSRVSPGWSYIHTHFGVGYRFAAESEGGVEDEPASNAAAAPAAEPVAEPSAEPRVARVRVHA